MFKLVIGKRGTRDQIANICWIMEKAREFQKNIYFCFIDYAQAFDLWITRNWKILKEMGIPDHLTCLLRNLYARQEATVQIEHGKQTGSTSGKEYIKAMVFPVVMYGCESWTVKKGER